MSLDAWHLPWGPQTVPHALLDIIRGCNISCRACYNSLPQAIKSVAEVESELKDLLARRRLGSVSLIGGEPLLHPHLDEILRLVKSYGLCAQIFTNGVLLDDHRLESLKANGLDIVLVHLDRGQIRPDLVPNPSREQLKQARETLAARIVRQGIDVGFTMTAFEDSMEEVRDMVECVLGSPHINYLLVTLFRNTENIAEIRGDLALGLQGRLHNPDFPRTDTLTNGQIIEYLLESLNLRPFAYLGSNRNALDPRWLSYLVSTCRSRQGNPAHYSIKASGFERLYLSLSLRLKGKYPMYREQSDLQMRVQLLLNAITGGDFSGNLKFLMQSFGPGKRLEAKRLLFQCPAEVGADGQVTHCLNCPDAVVKAQGLVPVCISDKANSEEILTQNSLPTQTRNSESCR